MNLFGEKIFEEKKGCLEEVHLSLLKRGAESEFLFWIFNFNWIGVWSTSAVSSLWSVGIDTRFLNSFGIIILLSLAGVKLSLKGKTLLSLSGNFKEFFGIRQEQSCGGFGGGSCEDGERGHIGQDGRGGAGQVGQGGGGQGGGGGRGGGGQHGGGGGGQRGRGWGQGGREGQFGGGLVGQDGGGRGMGQGGGGGGGGHGGSGTGQWGRGVVGGGISGHGHGKTHGRTKGNGQGRR